MAVFVARVLAQLALPNVRLPRPESRRRGQLAKTQCAEQGQRFQTVQIYQRHNALELANAAHELCPFVGEAKLAVDFVNEADWIGHRIIDARHIFAVAASFFASEAMYEFSMAPRTRPSSPPANAQLSSRVCSCGWAAPLLRCAHVWA
jgi:hypothetical protein